MSRQVYLNTWKEQLEATLEEVANQASAYPSGSAERKALITELGPLRALRQQVREISPDERRRVQSVIGPLSAREHLQLPDGLLSRIGELFDIYERFHNRLSWNS